jgi:hypothetical protein
MELLQSAERGITLRTLDKNDERVELDVYRFLDSGSSLAEVVEQRLGAEPAVQRSWRAPLGSLLARAMVPNVVLDRGETLAGGSAASSVERFSFDSRAGAGSGEGMVTARTARLLAALAGRNTPRRSAGGRGRSSGLLAGAWHLPPQVKPFGG